MEKIILVDGNNLIFRSYYATAATGNLMVNSKNYPTNALYGFTNMINKIIEEEKPTFMAVAYDIGKNFRHDKYKEYKAGRSATPNELIIQLNKSKELLDAMGIKHIELENYEADDIIGTLSKMALDDKDFIATIVSSDKDLLQLINEEVEVKLLKSKDYIRYTKEKFIEDYGIDPIKMIDLKALMGDSSDNVPGVKGIGEKTALKLLQQYNSLEGIYNSIDTIKGATHDKLINDKDTAFFCKDICTICLNAPIKENLTDCKYLGPNNNKLIEIYKELEFYSLLKKMDFKQETTKSNYKILNNVKEINKDNKISYYIECDNENYHDAKLLGMGLYDGKNLFYVKPEMINECLDYLKDTEKYTYDLKKNINLLNNINLNTSFDLMIAAYLLNYQIKEDLAVLMNKEEIYIPFYNEVIKSKTHENEVTLKAKYIFDNKWLLNEQEIDSSTTNGRPIISGSISSDLNFIPQFTQEIQTYTATFHLDSKTDIVSSYSYGTPYSTILPKIVPFCESNSALTESNRSVYPFLGYSVNSAQDTENLIDFSDSSLILTSNKEFYAVFGQTKVDAADPLNVFYPAWEFNQRVNYNDMVVYNSSPEVSVPTGDTSYDSTGYVATPAKGWVFKQFVTIPAKYNGEDVVEVKGFENNTDINKVYFEKGTKIRVIGYAAFQDTKYLTYVDFPDSLRQICNSAFQRSSLILNTFLGGKNTTVIGQLAFNSCLNGAYEKTYQIPSSVCIICQGGLSNMPGENCTIQIGSSNELSKLNLSIDTAYDAWKEDGTGRRIIRMNDSEEHSSIDFYTNTYSNATQIVKDNITVASVFFGDGSITTLNILIGNG